MLPIHAANLRDHFSNKYTIQSTRTVHQDTPSSHINDHSQKVYCTLHINFNQSINFKYTHWVTFRITIRQKRHLCRLNKVEQMNIHCPNTLFPHIHEPNLTIFNVRYTIDTYFYGSLRILHSPLEVKH